MQNEVEMLNKFMDASNEAEYTLMLDDISDESYVDQTVTDAPEF